MARYPGSNKNIKSKRKKSRQSAAPGSSSRNNVLNTKLNKINNRNKKNIKKTSNSTINRPMGGTKRRTPMSYQKPDGSGNMLRNPCPPGYYQCPLNFCGPLGQNQECVTDLSSCYFCPEVGTGEVNPGGYVDPPVGPNGCPDGYIRCWDRSCAPTINQCPPNPNFNPGEGEYGPGGPGGYVDFPGTSDWMGSGNTGGGAVTINYQLHHGQNLLSFPFLTTTGQSSIGSIMGALTSHNMPSTASIVGITTEMEAASYNAVSDSWVGNLTNINPLKSYWVNVTNPSGNGFTLSLTGVPLISTGSPIYNLNGVVPTYISYPNIRNMDFCVAMQNFSDGSVHSIVGEGVAATYAPNQQGPCGNGWLGNLVNSGFQMGKGYIFTAQNQINNFQFNI